MSGKCVGSSNDPPFSVRGYPTSKTQEYATPFSIKSERSFKYLSPLAIYRESTGRARVFAIKRPRPPLDRNFRDFRSKWYRRKSKHLRHLVYLDHLRPPRPPIFGRRKVFCKYHYSTLHCRKLYYTTSLHLYKSLYRWSKVVGTLVLNIARLFARPL